MSHDLYRGLIHAPDAGKPIIFVFHGTGGDERQFFEFARRLVPGAGVVSPRGDVSEMGAARFFKRTGKGVYDMEDLAFRTERMARFVDAHKADHPESPVYGFGYSNGANILASVMMSNPDLFDRAALLHPLIPWTPAPAPELKDRQVLITAGRRDPIAPTVQTAALIDWFKTQGAQVQAEIHEGGHELRDGEIDALSRFLKSQDNISAWPDRQAKAAAF